MAMAQSDEVYGPWEGGDLPTSHPATPDGPPESGTRWCGPRGAVAMNVRGRSFTRLPGEGPRVLMAVADHLQREGLEAERMEVVEGRNARLHLWKVGVDQTVLLRQARGGSFTNWKMKAVPFETLVHQYKLSQGGQGEATDAAGSAA